MSNNVTDEVLWDKIDSLVDIEDVATWKASGIPAKVAYDYVSSGLPLEEALKLYEAGVVVDSSAADDVSFKTAAEVFEALAKRMAEMGDAADNAAKANANFAKVYGRQQSLANIATRPHHFNNVFKSGGALRKGGKKRRRGRIR